MSFLQKESNKKKKRHLSKKQVILFLLVLFFIYNIVAFCFIAIGIFRVNNFVKDLQIQTGQLAFEGAQQSVLGIGDGLNLARTGTDLLFWIKPIPFIGDQVKGAGLFFHAGEASTEAVSKVLIIADDIAKDVFDAEDAILSGETFIYNDLDEKLKVKLLRKLYQSTGDLREVKVELGFVQNDLARIGELRLLPKFESIVSAITLSLPDLIDGIDTLVPFAQSVNELAGLSGARQWLVLFMNDMELRPGGGFIGVYGLVTVENGDITNIRVEDSYTIDSLIENNDAYTDAPPLPLGKYMGEDKWYLRDANWSPDFKESAQTAAMILREESSSLNQPIPQIDGVIAFSPTFGKWILELLGPVTIHDKTYNSKNLSELLEFEVEFGYKERGVDFSDRKETVGLLVEETSDRLLNMDVLSFAKAFSIFDRGLQEKQLVLYSFKSAIQNVFSDSGWGGIVESNAVDTLLIADANLDSLKSDLAVKRSINYSIYSVKDGFNAKVEITYNHEGEYDDFTTRYQTYTRVYAPLMSKLIKVEGEVENTSIDIVDDLQMTSFGALFVIKPGETKTVSFEYSLPQEIVESIDNGIYSLSVLKQIAAQNNLLTLDLDFDKKVKVAVPPEGEQEYGDSKYKMNTILDQDKRFSVQF